MILELLSPLYRRIAAREIAPRTSRVPGLRAEVEVLYTPGGIPHLYAQDADDLFFAQGYVHASERMFQMDFVRRAASGRLAEVLGDRPVGWRDLTVWLKDKSLVDLDHFTRLLGLAKWAKASAHAATGKSRRALERFAQGVNARLTEGELPVECRLLGYKPEAWAPEDTYLVLKAMALELNVSWRAILTYAALSEILADHHKVRALFPSYPKEAPTIVPGVGELAAAAAAESRTVGMGGPHAGSNNWVLSGKRTTSGAPMLANDPHLQLTSPAAFYVAHLSGGEYDVAGASIPGVPGVILGHNRDLAWGATICMAHDSDLFIEEVKGDSYLAGEGKEPIVSRVEEIRVKGGKSVKRTVRETRHGPLLSDLVRPRDGRALAMRWTAHAATHEVDAVLGMNRATNVTDFKAALGDLTAPGLNIVYAHLDGTVGYLATGRYPVRRGKPSYLPRDGKSGREDWSGFVPFEELPRIENPHHGVIATANNRIAPHDFPHYLSDLYEPPYRVARIYALLAGKEKHSLDDLGAIQMDVKSSWALRILHAVVKPVVADVESALLTPTARENAAKLLAWDGVARPSSAEAALYHAFYGALVRGLLGTLLGEDVLFGYLELLNNSVVPLENLLIAEHSPMLDAETRATLVGRALHEATDELRRSLGDDESTWRWGRMHKLHLRHRMHEARPLRPLLSPGPYETGGDGMTVNNGQFFFSNPAEHVLGAAYRQLFDLADWDKGRVVVAGGQSGNPFSARYREHVDRWLNGGYFPLPFSREAVQHGAIGEAVRLRP